MPRGLKKLTHAASAQAAWQDWHALESWARENGRDEAARFHAPNEGAGWKTIDKQIEQLRVALGAPAGAWGDDVLAGLNPKQQPLPPAVRPIVEEALAAGDLVKANEGLHQLSGGKTIQQVADGWAGQVQVPAAEPEQREQQQQEQPDPQLPPAEPRPSRPAEGAELYPTRVPSLPGALRGDAGARRTDPCAIWACRWQHPQAAHVFAPRMPSASC